MSSRDLPVFTSSDANSCPQAKEYEWEALHQPSHDHSPLRQIFVVILKLHYVFIYKFIWGICVACRADSLFSSCGSWVLNFQIGWLSNNHLLTISLILGQFLRYDI